MRISDWSSDVCSSDLGFDPLLPGFKYAEFNDLEGALALIDEHTAGFLVEPIQGEGGIRPATDAFLKGLRKACDEHGLLLVLDEVQCGYGRTGKFFAHELYGLTPDIMARSEEHTSELQSLMRN